MIKKCISIFMAMVLSFVFLFGNAEVNASASKNKNVSIAKVTVKTPSATIDKLKKGGTYSIVIRAFFSDKSSKKIYGGKFEIKP